MKLLCAVFLNSALLASNVPSSAAIHGQVLDPNGAVIARATIRVLDADSRQAVQTVTSDSSGQFAVDGLAPGRYQLAVFATGFVEELLGVDLTQKEPDPPLTIHLEILDCDAPHVNCDIFTTGPYTEPHPILLQRDLTVNAADGVNLDTGTIVPERAANADLHLISAAGALYLAGLNGAALTTRGSEGGCGKVRVIAPLRIDGFGPNSEIVMRTHSGNCSRIFVTREIPAGANRADFHVVTRAK